VSTSEEVEVKFLVQKAFSDDGPLAETMPDFEPRPSQQAMAAAAEQIFSDGGVLLVEAGTGTGKTLAYLVPAILSRRRIIISTGTKNLQDQIFHKDLPALRDVLKIPFTATYMKGRANYLCLHRFKDVQEDVDLNLDDNSYIEEIAEWAIQTETGDRSEIEDLPDEFPLWNKIAATSENCIGTECPSYEECFITKMKQNAMESDLVIVNHHLLCADASVRQSVYGEVIPSYSYVVVDEAHQLEDVATQYFGVVISNYRFEDLARDGRRFFTAENDQKFDSSGYSTVKFEEFSKCGQVFFSVLLSAVKNKDRTRVTGDTLSPASKAARELSVSLENLIEHLCQLRETTEEIKALVRKLTEFNEQLLFLMSATNTDYVYFLERRRNGIFLRASPIDVSHIVNQLLLHRTTGAIFTSATLTVEGTFDYLRSRLGIEEAIELRLPSEFDFSEQAIMFLPRNIPDPRNQDFSQKMAEELSKLLQITKGRAFVLFTSYANLREVHHQLENNLPYPLLVQGTAPRTVLLREFRSTPQAVLLATSSFWQGVDVSGDALSCVVIDKLPFASPSDPITAARMDLIEETGGNAFSDYQVPLATLTLLQGLGRLIRHRSDRGVMALFDSRLHTKYYGRRFLASLPPATITDDLFEVEKFFRNCRP
tara:strand:- start:972 stop:2930 length:1959 start_codon:yes stop_codon:yes gene_type:complete